MVRRPTLRRHAAGALAAALTGLMALSACSGPNPVVASTMPVDDDRLPGPSYLQFGVWDAAETGSVVRTPSGARTVAPSASGDEPSGALWGHDGSLVLLSSAGARVLTDDGERDVRTPGLNPGAASLTAEALTVLNGDDEMALELFDPDLTSHRTVEVPLHLLEVDDAVDRAAELHLHGDPVTLDEVTWVEWSINSEDERSGHGVLRIEGDEIREVLRDAAVVRLYAAYDSSALLMLRQSNDQEDCGGCVVAQDLVEIDPESGEVVGEYGTPPGYSKHWRVDAVDKVGDTVAVRYRVAVDDEGSGAGQWQLWTYDGEWSRLEEWDGRRVWFQGGGRLVETPIEGGASRWTAAEEQPAVLTWVPGEDGPVDGGEVLYEPDDRTCVTDRQGRGEQICPRLVTGGSLLPRP